MINTLVVHRLGTDHLLVKREEFPSFHIDGKMITKGQIPEYHVLVTIDVTAQLTKKLLGTVNTVVIARVKNGFIIKSFDCAEYHHIHRKTEIIENYLSEIEDLITGFVKSCETIREAA
jgi:hypothetical protein